MIDFNSDHLNIMLSSMSLLEYRLIYIPPRVLRISVPFIGKWKQPSLSVYTSFSSIFLHLLQMRGSIVRQLSVGLLHYYSSKNKISCRGVMGVI